MDKLKKVAIVMPTYNGAAFLRPQLDSILNQSYPHWVLLIRDDHSTDETIRILQEYAQSRPQQIKILPSNERLGVIKSIETLLEQVVNMEVDAVCLADQDDIWVPNKLEESVKFLNEYCLVVHDAILVDSKENQLVDSFFIRNRSKPGFIHNLRRNSYLGCCMLFQKVVLNKALPFPANTPMHDIWIGNVASRLGKVLFLPSTLVKYRRHGNNASSTSESSTQSLFKKIQDRVIVLNALIKRGMIG